MLAQSFSRIERRLFVALVLLVSLVFACGDSGERCFPGDKLACTCDDGAPGYKECVGIEKGYSACDCSDGSTTSSSGAGGGGGQGGASGLLPFMAECEEDSQCESGMCFTYTSKGSRCTLQCSSDNQCPAPSPGCNNMGVCRAP